MKTYEIKFLKILLDINYYHLLDIKNALKIYFSFIHIYISYANNSWATTLETKLHVILKKQKYAGRCKQV